MKNEKINAPDSTIRNIIDKLDSKLESAGYSNDAVILPRLKNTSTYHKIRRRMFSGGMPPTLLELDERFSAMSKKYRFLKIGFWSVYPILFAAATEDDLAKDGFTNLIKRYNHDVSDFFPYCTKCVLKVTIWPKVEIHSYPKGYLAIILKSDSSRVTELITRWRDEWSKLAGFETFGVLPPLLIDTYNKKVLNPFSRSKLTKYPPSIKELSDSLFAEK